MARQVMNVSHVTEVFGEVRIYQNKLDTCTSMARTQNLFGLIYGVSCKCTPEGETSIFIGH